MPVPKKRTTAATKGQRRSHDSLKSAALILEKSSNVRVPRRLHKAASLGIARVRKG
ncbi:50S ribosomal protein L32 [bacterium]|nr:50S ribosomal protein L32 [bacterium]